MGRVSGSEPYRRTQGSVKPAAGNSKGSQYEWARWVGQNHRKIRVVIVTRGLAAVLEGAWPRRLCDKRGWQWSRQDEQWSWEWPVWALKWQWFYWTSNKNGNGHKHRQSDMALVSLRMGNKNGNGHKYRQSEMELATVRMCNTNGKVILSTGVRKVISIWEPYESWIRGTREREHCKNGHGAKKNLHTWHWKCWLIIVKVAKQIPFLEFKKTQNYKRRCIVIATHGKQEWARLGAVANS